jgi:hypothetical protein
MIKDFPEFGQLEIGDKDEILKLTKDFLHYSDFNFNNLWARDIAVSKRGFAKLNGNLILRMFNYKTNKPFYSICGSYKYNETVEVLFKFMDKEGSADLIRLIPEEFAEKVTLSYIIKEEDRDSFDYIYLVEELKSFDGGKFKQKRNEVNTLLAEHPEIKVRELDIRDPSIRKEISCLFHRWVKNKIAKGDEYELRENDTFNNTLILSETQDLILVGIYLKERLVAFIISEIQNSEYAIGLFAKMDYTVKGINAFLVQSLAKVLSKRSIKYFNYEDDIGLENLRVAKMRFRPVFLLKKYTLKLQKSKSVV